MKTRSTSKSINEALNRLDFVIIKSSEILNYFQDKKKTDPELFCFLITERLNSASFGLKNLLKDMVSNKQLEYSCGIILRSVLLDYMIVLNAIIKISDSTSGKDANDELNLFCSTMLSECVNHTLKDISKLKFPSEDQKKLYKNIAQMYSECIEPYANDGSVPIPKFQKTYSPGKLFEKIFNNKDFRQYSNTYEAYLFYSKYDHFGRMYDDFQRHNIADRVYRINESTKVFPKVLQYITAILFILHQTDMIVQQQFEAMQEYIREH